MTKMVQRAIELVDQTPNKETTLKLIDTIRTITAGKVQYFRYFVAALAGLRA